MHLPPIPAGIVIAAVCLWLVASAIVRVFKRRLRRAIGRQLRQSFVAGFAAGSAAGWTMGRRGLPARVQRVRGLQ